MLNRKKNRLANPAVLRAFPYQQKWQPRPEDANWFDRHPIVSGALYGAVLCLIIWGLT